jgi:flagellar biogenesis protein FliO
LPSVVTVAGSLALVLGIFFLVAWGMRRASPAGGTALPGEVFEVLGRAAMASRQQVHLLRCGNKLILVSVTTAGAETLTEITDPAEVDRLAGLCRQAHPNSATAAFRQVFGQFASGHGRTGLFAASDRDDLRPAGAAVPANLDGLENRDV